MELHNGGQSLIHQDYPTILLAHAHHLLQGLLWSHHVLQPKKVHNTIELVIFEGHLSHISNHIVEVDCRTCFGGANSSHVGTPINQSEISARLIER